MRGGQFITFEGIDGSGKSTQARLLTEFLANKGIEVILTREPGGTRVAEKIRQILLDKEHFELVPRAELLLYLASRAQHTDEIIQPALNNGKWVISDRFSDSSIAYQGSARNLGTNTVHDMSLFATGGLVPDLTFFLDISVEEASRRMHSQNKILDRLESEAETFSKLVREGYLWVAKREPERFIIIDGQKPIDDVWRQIEIIILGKYPFLAQRL